MTQARDEIKKRKEIEKPKVNRRKLNFLVATGTAVAAVILVAVVVGLACTHTTIGLHYDRCEQRIFGIL